MLKLHSKVVFYIVMMSTVLALVGALESGPTAHLGFDASTDARPVSVWLQLDADVFVVRAEHETRLVVALRRHLVGNVGKNVLHHMKHS